MNVDMTNENTETKTENPDDIATARTALADGVARKSLPAGWSVELLGLANAVVFTNSHRQLMWSDGTWQMVVTSATGQHVMNARGVPQASTMTEARKVGTAWIVMCEDEDA